MDNFSLTEHQDEFSLEEAEQGNFSAFGDIIKGDKGDPGAVFTPAVDSNGNISWTNDGGLPNPETQNIKGPQGDPGNYTKPATGIPKTDLAEDVQTSLGKADAALPAFGGDGSNVTAAFTAASSRANIATGEKLSVIFGKITKWFSDLGTAAFRAATNAITQGSTDLIESGAVYTGLAAKQGTINASGILKGGGAGGVTAATAGTDYQTPLTAGTDYETPAGAKTLGLTGAVVGDLARVAAVDANGKPTSWNHVPLCEIKTNPNLLDNWYFVGGGSQRTDVSCAFPINQREKTIYPGTGYDIDRWRTWEASNTTEITSDEITITRQVAQLIENGPSKIGDKTVTISALFSDNELLKASGEITLPSGGTKLLLSTEKANFANVLLYYDGTNISYQINLLGSQVGTATGIKAVKLELGSEQTLAHQENGAWVLNEIPNYEQELAKCQRYCIALVPGGANYQWIGNGIVWNETEADAFIPTPVTMRSAPTAEDPANWYLWFPSRVNATSITLQRTSNGLKAVIGITNGTAGTPFLVGSRTSGTKLIVSCDL